MIHLTGIPNRVQRKIIQQAINTSKKIRTVNEQDQEEGKYPFTKEVDVIDGYTEINTQDATLINILKANGFTE